MISLVDPHEGGASVPSWRQSYGSNTQMVAVLVTFTETYEIPRRIADHLTERELIVYLQTKGFLPQDICGW